MAQEFKTQYSQKLASPQWEMKRKEILDRDLYTCVHCGQTGGTLQAHHLYYLPDHEPWQYPNSALITLCEACHLIEHMWKTGYKDSMVPVLTTGYSYQDLYRVHFGLLNAANIKEPSHIAAHIEKLLTDHDFIAEIKKH